MKTQKIDFILRPWNISDLDNLVRFANNKKIADNLSDAFPHPYSREDGIAYITAHHPDRVSHPDGVSQPGSVFAIEVNGIACGSIGIFPQTDLHRKNAELGYWLAEDYWGRGIITEAIERMIEFGFKKFDINRIFARTFSTNLASQRALEKAGMMQEARLKNSIVKNGQYLDELIFSILLNI